MFDETFFEVRRAALGTGHDFRVDGELESFRLFADALAEWLIARGVQPTQLQAVPGDEATEYSLLIHVDPRDKPKLDTVIADLWFWISQRIPLKAEDLALLFSCGFDHRSTILTPHGLCAICVQPDAASHLHAFPAAAVWRQIADAIAVREGNA